MIEAEEALVCFHNRNHHLNSSTYNQTYFITIPTVMGETPLFDILIIFNLKRTQILKYLSNKESKSIQI